MIIIIITIIIITIFRQVIIVMAWSYRVINKSIQLNTAAPRTVPTFTLLVLDYASRREWVGYDCIIYVYYYIYLQRDGQMSAFNLVTVCVWHKTYRKYYATSYDAQVYRYTNPCITRLLGLTTTPVFRKISIWGWQTPQRPTSGLPPIRKWKSR